MSWHKIAEVRGLAFIVVLVCCARIGRADNKPWAAGVEEKDQNAALALYREGNKFFEDSQYKEAYARYDKALASWKHPAIHYNAAVCLINMDKPVEALEHIEASLRFGAAPLGNDLYKQALIYQKTLEGQLAVLSVSCTEPGTRVTLDGAPLLVCPGTEKRRLRPGAHQLVGAKPRFETTTIPITLAGGQKEAREVPMKLQAAARRQVRRWNRFLPWVVVGAGVVGGGVGVPLIRSSIDEREEFVTTCGTNPCAPAAAADALALLDSAEKHHNLALGAFFAGGAITATGILMIVLNQPRLVPATITPSVGREHASLMLSGQW